jgi:hypothetical protein
MINLIASFLIWSSCAVGQPIRDWPGFVASRNYVLTETASVRIATDAGPVYIWEFDGDVIFVTRPGSIHGQCARLLP